MSTSLTDDQLKLVMAFKRYLIKFMAECNDISDRENVYRQIMDDYNDPTCLTTLRLSNFGFDTEEAAGTWIIGKDCDDINDMLPSDLSVHVTPFRPVFEEYIKDDVSLLGEFLFDL